jgi:hypothetical protein
MPDPNGSHTHEPTAQPIQNGGDSATAVSAIPDDATDAQKQSAVDDEVDESNDAACCEVFNEYQPEWVSKLIAANSIQAVPHPDTLVETTSLACTKYVEAVDYDVTAVANLMKPGSLSAAQLETTLLAGSRHQTLLPNGARAAFFLGDGAGVGKGRQIASVIMDNWLRVRPNSSSLKGANLMCW